MAKHLFRLCRVPQILLNLLRIHECSLFALFSNVHYHLLHGANSFYRSFLMDALIGDYVLRVLLTELGWNGRLLDDAVGD